MRTSTDRFTFLTGATSNRGAGALALALLFLACAPDETPEAAKPAALIQDEEGQPPAEQLPLLERVPPSKPEKTVVRKGVEMSHMVVLKLLEGSRIRLRGSRYQFDPSILKKQDVARLQRRNLDVAAVAQDLDRLHELLDGAQIFKPRPMLSAPEEELQMQQQEAEAQSLEEMADLNLYTHWIADENLATPETTALLINRLNRLAIVEIAYAEPVPDVAQPLAAPDLSGSQRYLDAAPIGIDARYAWTVPGGFGDRVRVVDVEYGFDPDHEDLPRSYLTVNDTAQFARLRTDRRDHGTAVSGIIAGQMNEGGIRGIAPWAGTALSSVTRWGYPNLADALSEGARLLRANDVLLIEMHAPGPSSGMRCDPVVNGNCEQWEFIALEYWQANFDIIRTATARGVIVVEAAGNGGMDLDARRYGRLFEREIRNSGAMMVGAGTPSGRAPYSWTNFGSRVDVQAWGRGVFTTGYGDAGMRYNAFDPHTWYTGSFGGTSSASAIIAGAAASLVSSVKAAGRTGINPAQVIEIFRRTGQPQAASPRQIGPLPDLRRAIPEAIRDPGLGVGVGAAQYYYLRPQHAPNKAVDVAGARTADQTDVWLWDLIYGLYNQQWAIVPDGAGYYELRARHSGKCMEVYGFSTSDGGQVVQWGCVGGDNQKWMIYGVPGEPGFFILRNKRSMKVLDVAAWGTANGTDILQWDYHWGSNQKFRLTPATL